MQGERRKHWNGSLTLIQMKIAFIKVNCLSANPETNFRRLISYSFNLERFFRNYHSRRMYCPCLWRYDVFYYKLLF